MVLRRKTQSTFCVSVRPWPHLGLHIGVPSFWTRRTSGYWLWGPSGTLLKEQSSYNVVQNMGHKGPVLRPRGIRPGRVRTQILFYSSHLERPRQIKKWPLVLRSSECRLIKVNMPMFRKIAKPFIFLPGQTAFLGCLTLKLKALEVWNLEKCLPKHKAVLDPEENTMQSIGNSGTFYPLKHRHFPKDLNVSRHLNL